MSSHPLPADQRPVDPTPVHTADLPPTPLRDRNIPASAWIEAPQALLHLGADIGGADPNYKRRIGPWLLWRAGPAKGARSHYLACHESDLSHSFVFTLDPDLGDAGVGPDGQMHDRFRSWKESLRDFRGLDDLAG